MAKKYKLKKKYPCLRSWIQEGDIAKFIESDGYYKISPKGKGRFPEYLKPRHIEDYPEFWEEIEETYKILKLSANQNNDRWETGKVITKKFDDYLPEGTWLKYWNIHSVKRLSDGEVFQIGDKVTYDYSGANQIWTIDRFENHRSGLAAYSKENNFCVIHTNNFRKAEPPLFTTEDGVDIYEGERFCYVTELNTIVSTIADEKRKIISEYKTFSNRQAAEEYIEEHKPRYSKTHLREAAARSAPSKSSLQFWGFFNTLISELENPGSMQ